MEKHFKLRTTPKVEIVALRPSLPAQRAPRLTGSWQPQNTRRLINAKRLECARFSAAFRKPTIGNTSAINKL
jgi:hypothetical protein